MKLKSVLATFLAATATISCFTACDGNNDNNTSDSEKKAGDKTTINWMDGRSTQDYQIEAVENYLVKPFEESNSNIDVNFIPTPDITQVLKIQLAAGEGPDLMTLEGPSSVGNFSDRLVDMTEYVEEYNWDEIMFDWALESCKVDDKYMSIPNWYEAIIMWHNNDLMKEHGWEVPKTVNELETMCQEAQDADLIPICYHTGGFIMGNDWALSLWYNNYCGRDRVKQLLAGQAKFTDEDFVAAIEMYNDWWQKGYIGEKQTHAISNEDSQSLYYSGKSPIFFHTTAMIGQMKQNCTFDYGMDYYPKFNDELESAVVPIACAGSLAINIISDVKDECAQYIDYIYRDTKNMAKGVEAGLSPFCTDIPTEDFSKDVDPMILQMKDIFAELEENPEMIGYCQWTFWPTATHEYQINNIEKVFLGQMTVQEFSEESQKVLDQDIAAGLVPTIP